jgi:glutaredoxin-related protein
MLSTLVKLVVVAAVVALVIESLPDIKRYLEMRDMLARHENAR